MRGFDGDAGVAAHDVEAPVLSDAGAHGHLHVAGGCAIGTVEDGFAAGLADGFVRAARGGDAVGQVVGLSGRGWCWESQVAR